MRHLALPGFLDAGQDRPGTATERDAAGMLGQAGARHLVQRLDHLRGVLGWGVHRADRHRGHRILRRRE